MAALFGLGGLGYVLLELIYRGRSHYSMFLAGGLCFLLLGKLEESRVPLWARPFIGAGLITLVELAGGLVFNRDHRVWDYRGVPLNFRGQVCLRFSLLWVPLAALGGWVYRRAKRLL